MKPPRIATILSILVLTPAGFLFKFYTGPFAWRLNDYGAGASYTKSSRTYGGAGGRRA